jgi:serine/threonine-protein kinase RsbW
VSEAVTNAIFYGHAPQRARLIFIECDLQENNMLKFVVSDSGNGFDFENVPDPTDPRFIDKEGGRGVFIMRKLADKCTFNKNGSEVVLEFDLNCS